MLKQNLEANEDEVRTLQAQIEESRANHADETKILQDNVKQLQETLESSKC